MQNISPLSENKRIEHEKKALNIIRKNQIATLATVNKEIFTLDMAPQSSSVLVVAEDNFDLYFLTKTHSRKQYNIQSYPMASFTFTDLKECKTVQIEGKVETVTDEKKIAHYGLQIRRSVSNMGRGFHPSEQIQEGNFVIFKCTPSWIRYGSFGYHPDKWDHFDVIRDTRNR